MYQVLAILAVFALLYGSVAGRIERTWISGPIAMTAVCTIILSILSHGVTANPWAQAFGRRHSQTR